MARMLDPREALHDVEGQQADAIVILRALSLRMDTIPKRHQGFVRQMFSRLMECQRDGTKFYATGPQMDYLRSIYDDSVGDEI